MAYRGETSTGTGTMKWLKCLWRGARSPGGDEETRPIPRQGERLFSIYENGCESVVLQQCLDDLAACGLDPFQCRQKARRILENARATASAEADRCGRADLAAA